MANRDNGMAGKALLFSMAVTSALVAACSADKNAQLEYGDTGLPKNCRAIIAANIEAWRNRTYPANEIIESIDRNCGANGHSW